MQPFILIAAILYFILRPNTATAYIWPVKIQIRITSAYHAPRGNSLHNGLDIAAPVGTPVFSPGAGTVDAIWNDTTNGGGLSLRIKAANGFTFGFAHLSKNDFYQVGAQVKQGAHIASTGNTGNSTGPHLHLTIRKDGNTVNPLLYLPTL